MTRGPSVRGLKVTDVAGNVTIYEYDDVLKETTEVDCLVSFLASTSYNINYGCDDVASPISTQLEHRQTVLVEIKSPVNPTVPDLSVEYDGAAMVKSVADAANNTWEYFSSTSRSSVKDPAVGQETIAYSPLPLIGGAGNLRSISRTIDQLDYATIIYTDGIGRLTKVIDPEGGCARNLYDSKHNVTQIKIWPKPIGAGTPCADNDPDLDPLTTLFEYGDTNWPKKKTKITEPNGNVTTITYAASNGKIGWYTEGVGSSNFYQIKNATDGQGRITETRIDPNGINLKKTYAYYPINGSSKAKHTNGELKTVTINPGGLNLITTLEYDDIGNREKVVEDNGNYTTQKWNKRRQIVRLHQGLGGSEQAITEWNYDADGRVVEQCRADPGATLPPTDMCTLTPTLQTSTFTYNDSSLLERSYGPYNPNDAQGHDSIYVKQTYTADGLPEKLFEPFNDVTDWRISQNFYNDRRELVRIEHGTDSSLRQDYARLTYSPNGNRLTVQDAKDHTTTYDYDGFDRLIKTTFSDGSCEELSYDDNGNVTTLIKRDGSKIVNEYDAVDRVIKKETFKNSASSHSCGATGSYNVNPDDEVVYTYNKAGQQTDIDHNGSAELSYSYDTAGRMISETQGLGAVSYIYRPSLCQEDVSWPDGFRSRSNCDALKRAWQIKAWKTTSEGGGQIGRLERFFYDSLGRRTEDNHMNNKQTFYDYHTDSALKTLDHRNVWWNTTNTFYESDFGYNHTNQVTSETVTPDSFVWREQALTTTDYQVNNLNQYTSVNEGTAITPQYDLNGNLSAYDKERFEYDPENRLIRYERDDSQGTLELSVDYEYDALGRRIKKTVKDEPSGPTNVIQYLYDGDQAIGEYNGQGIVLRRYVYDKQGGIDDIYALVDELTDGSGPNRDIYYYHLDSSRSVIALTDDSGSLANEYAYSPFGVDTLNQTTVGQPYRYTGRRFDEETGLYYYRARYYHTELGRFLQTDPIGFADQMNLYSYVANDPVNGTDPFGLVQGFGSESNDIVPDRYQGIERMGAFNPWSSPRPLPRVFAGISFQATGGDGPSIGRLSPKAQQAIRNARDAVGQFVCSAMGMCNDSKDDDESEDKGASNDAIAGSQGTPPGGPDDPNERPLTQKDLGIQGAMSQVRGTVSLKGDVLVVRVEFIEGTIKNPFQIVKNLQKLAGAHGASTLRIEATLANQRLFTFLSTRYNIVTRGSIDIIELPAL